MQKNDEIFELICISPCEYNPEELTEFTLGYYSKQEIVIKQKEICEKQANEENQDLQYRVEKHRIIL